MDEQNNPVPEPAATQPAGEANTPVIMEPVIAPEPTAPAVEQTAQAETSAPTPEPTTAQLPPTAPFADPASAGGGEATQPTQSIGGAEAAQSPSTPAPAQPEPASQPASVPAQAPVIVVQNRIKDFFAKAAQAIQFRKQKKLTKIMTLFLKKTHITNDEVEKLLHVSDATATRYLSQLEKQGKIKQSGRLGQGVTYTKI